MSFRLESREIESGRIDAALDAPLLGYGFLFRTDDKGSAYTADENHALSRHTERLFDSFHH